MSKLREFIIFTGFTPIYQQLHTFSEAFFIRFLAFGNYWADFVKTFMYVKYLNFKTIRIEDKRMASKYVQQNSKNKNNSQGMEENTGTHLPY